MRHVFILNPVAGKNHMAVELRGKIDAYFARHPELEYSIRITDGVGAATRIAQEECEAGDRVRLYACGGDGTLQETASGIPIGSESVELAVIPCGSGNDYIRTFGSKEDFMRISDLVEADAYPVDAVDCGDRISLNIASMGMDASVGQKMQRYKNLPGVSGSMAYNIAVADVFFHPIGEKMTIEIDSVDGYVRRDGRYLLALAANGRYYGGGYCGAPKAVENDGLLDFVLVKKIPRPQIPFVLGKYKKGDHDSIACLEHIRGTGMRIVAEKSMVCNVDGECFDTQKMSFTVMPAAFRFVIPHKVVEERAKHGIHKRDRIQKT